jgi:hypothetical protein
MKRGGKFFGTAAILSVAACGGEQGKLEIRPIGAPLAAVSKPVPLRIAEARGHLALGNVALALESFRKAMREDPGSVDAQTGVAACYDRMARFDLARRHYEAALALAPRDPHVLAAFAASLDAQGLKSEAASVRAEIAQRVAMAAPAPAAKPVTVLPSIPKPAERVVPRPQAVAGLARLATPAPVAAPVAPAPPTLKVAAVVPSPRQSAVVAPKPVQSAEVTPEPNLPAATPPKPIQSAAVVPAPAAPAAKPAIGRSVTVALPPARPVAAPQPVAKPVPKSAAVALSPVPVVPVRPAVEVAVVTALPPAPRVAEPPTTKPAVEVPAKIARTEAVAAPAPTALKPGPRLERTSLREVALVTVAEPKWRPVAVGRSQRSATIRFVPLRQASASVSRVRILNAARVNRLAARTRSYLVNRGWSPMVIGDAPRIRARSVIFYPPERRRTALRLSAQFGFMIAQRPGAREITVLLGQDAARISALRARG